MPEAHFALEEPGQHGAAPCSPLVWMQRLPRQVPERGCGGDTVGDLPVAASGVGLRTFAWLLLSGNIGRPAIDTVW
jgi:hypothetical protein